MLTSDVKTTGDLMSIALQAEREAIRRYTDLAAKMHECNNQSAAALFERMVAEEREHEDLLEKWMTQEGIQENPDIGPVSWKDPNISTTYDDEARDPQYSTPYKALAFAVHNEEIAFSFYTHVAAETKDTAIHEYAEILAREELGHAALLRAERRRAYHAEREAGTIEPKLNPRNIHNETDLLTAAIYIDRYLATEMEKILKTTPEIASLIEEINQQISNNEKALDSNTSANEDIIKDIEKINLHHELTEKTINSIDLRLQRIHAYSDHSFAFYDRLVDTSPNEAVMLGAQKLTSIALDRIGALKQIFGNAYMVDDNIA
ncbi:MAG: ferritin family protein, partial [Gammaproteobacteria bacterium]|nr:ferritin family protein [Gammaproteobacteria bacterium]